jgi:hypothetical protein
MTEVVVLSHITPLEMDNDVEGEHLGSCGKLLPGFEAKVEEQRDKDGQGDRLWTTCREWLSTRR